MEYIYKNDEIGKIRNNPKPISIMDSMDNNEGTVYHTNYLDYLSICYGSHNGIVVKPDFIWYTILCEISNIIKKDPKTYQNIFTDSDEKKEIVVFSKSLVLMPIDSLINELFQYIPSGLDKNDILLNFSTTTKLSTFAFSTAFLDTVSPYYRYSMTLCGFNKINVLGTFNDYNLIKDIILEKLNPIFGINTDVNNYLLKCFTVLVNMLENFEDQNFWKNILYIENCGSGHTNIVCGWFSDLFYKRPELAYVTNFPTHKSFVIYKNDLDETHKMESGILSSIIEDDYLIPDFHFFINKV